MDKPSTGSDLKKLSQDIHAAEFGAAVGCNDLSSVSVIDAANNAAVNTSSGHGIMAERALTLLDKIGGRDTANIGRDNAKDGADRIVNGTALQTKFYSSGKGCVDACFADKADGGMYRYINTDGTPMPVEVPQDMYDEAAARFAEKIADGKVPGVTDTADADKYVKASALTYDNARSLCRPLTKESLLYDAGTGITVCTAAMCVSAAAVLVMSLFKRQRPLKALVSALKAGLGVFAITFICHVLISQIARTEMFKSVYSLFETLLGSSKAVMNIARDINNGLCGLTGGAHVSAEAAVRQLAKILSAGVLINTVTLIVFLLPGFVLMLCRRMTPRMFGWRLIGLIIARICAFAALTAVAVLLSVFSGMPALVGTTIGLIAACAGSIYGQSIIMKKVG